MKSRWLELAVPMNAEHERRIGDRAEQGKEDTMLVTMKEILDKAMAGKYAVGAFNVPNLESIQATIEAAEELGVPVIIQHAQVHEDGIEMAWLRFGEALLRHDSVLGPFHGAAGIL